MAWVSVPAWGSFTFPTVSSLETASQTVPTALAPANIPSGQHRFDGVPDLSTSVDDLSYPIASG